jgi:hypothetical protein
VAEEAMEAVMEEAAAVVADFAVGKMHAVAARKTVEAVTMEAGMVALCAIRHTTAMVSLDAVAKEVAKVAVCELRQGIVTREAEAETQMYMDDAAAEVERAASAVTWALVDCDETEVEVEAERNVELRAAEVAIRAASAQRDAKLAERSSSERYERRWAEDLADTQ